MVGSRQSALEDSDKDFEGEEHAQEFRGYV